MFNLIITKHINGETEKTHKSFLSIQSMILFIIPLLTDQTLTSIEVRPK